MSFSFAPRAKKASAGMPRAMRSQISAAPRSTHGPHSAGEGRQEAVAGGLEDAATMGLRDRFDDLRSGRVFNSIDPKATSVELRRMSDSSVAIAFGTGWAARAGGSRRSLAGAEIHLGPKSRPRYNEHGATLFGQIRS
jgi:hypothetical protein